MLKVQEKHRESNKPLQGHKKPVLIKIKKWRKDAKLPTIALNGDAGMDCYIHAFKKIIDPQKHILKEIPDKEYELQPLERIGCPLGFAAAIPEGYYAQVVPRSGLALWEGITLLNTPGTIDSGYRNEWMAIVVNLSNQPVKLRVGERICQFIIRKMEEVTLLEVEELPDSERGLSGFGSTGKN